MYCTTLLNTHHYVFNLRLNNSTVEAIEELLRIKFLVPRYTSSPKLLDYFNTHHFAKLKTTQINPLQVTRENKSRI